MLANKGSYTPEDIVFVSAEGSRSGRLPVDVTELRCACEGGAKIITDVRYDRERSYNVGEREAASTLLQLGYHEVRDGQWIANKP